MADDFDTDVQWLRDLHKKSWKKHPPQYSGGRKTSYGHSEDLPISEKDRKKILDLFVKHQSKFVFEPGSGVFGFGVSISAGIVRWPTYPGVPTEVEWVICVTSKQMFPRRDADNAYATFEKFTHTEENKKLRQDAGFKEPLKNYAYYDY